MKPLFTATAFLFAASSAFAQAWDGTGEQRRKWVANPTNPVGAAPADAIEPADLPDIGFNEADWIDTNVTSCTGLPVCEYFHGNRTRERKFRIVCEPGTNKQLDPILFPGQAPPVGHRHQGVGNVGWDENSTTATLRSNPSSTCSGGPLNGTIYWLPELLKDMPSGAAVGIRQQFSNFYYTNGAQGSPQELTWLRRNTAFIGGANPNDYNDQARRKEYAKAGLLYPGSPDTPAGFGGWQCYRGSDGAQMTVTRGASRMKTDRGIEVDYLARHLKAEDGSDPWGGTCTGSESKPGNLILNLGAPSCWDGHNLRSPNGRGHFYYAATKADSSIVDACPDGWAKVPALVAKEHYFHAGFSDYGHWYFSSDRMNPTNAPADRSSLDPCRRNGPWFCNGSTGHFDWIYGWKTAIADEWQRECLGITVKGVPPSSPGGAECDNSVISKTRRIKAGGTSPNPAMSGGCTVILACSDAVPGNVQRYSPAESATAGPHASRWN